MDFHLEISKKRLQYIQHKGRLCRENLYDFHQTQHKQTEFGLAYEYK